MRLNANKKFFYKTLLLIFIAFIIIINLLSISLSKAHEHVMIEKIKAIRLENLREINNMSEHLSNLVVLLSRNILEDNTINKILDHTTSNYGKIEAMRKISSIQSMSINIHSIWIYSESENKIYSSIDEDSSYILDLMKEELTSDTNRSFEQDIVEIGEKLVHAYIFPMGNSLDSKDKLIINLDLGWINQISSKQNTQLYLINNDRGKIYSIEKSTQPLEALDFKILEENPEYAAGILEGNMAFTQVDNYYEENEIVTYAGLQDTSWSLMNMSSKDDILQYQKLTKKYTFNLIIFFLFLTLLLSLLLSRRIIKPFNAINKLLLDFKGANSTENPVYLTDSIVNILDDIKNLEKKAGNYSEKLNKEVLKEVLLGNIKGKEIYKVFREYEFDLSWANNCIIIYCHQGAKFLKTSDINNDNIVRSLEIGDDMVYILRQIPYQEMNRIIDMFIFSGVKYIIVSNRIRGIENIHREYLNVLEKSKESIFYPKGSTIFLEDCSMEKIVYPIEVEAKIISSLRGQDIDGCQEELDEFINRVSKCSYNIFELHTMRLFFALRNLVLEVSNGNIDTEIFDAYSFKSTFTDIKDVEELRACFLEKFKEIRDLIYKSKSEKNIKIVKKAMNLVYEKYQESSLTVQDIAEELDLSPSYLNQLAKQEYDVSISQYINDIRIEKAKEDLINSSKTIKEIAIEVGFNNDNYFYSVFKKEIGMTPGQFRKKNQLNKL